MDSKSLDMSVYSQTWTRVNTFQARTVVSRLKASLSALWWASAFRVKGGNLYRTPSDVAATLIFQSSKSNAVCQLNPGPHCSIVNLCLFRVGRVNYSQISALLLCFLLTKHNSCCLPVQWLAWNSDFHISPLCFEVIPREFNRQSFGRKCLVHLLFISREAQRKSRDPSS